MLLHFMLTYVLRLDIHIQYTIEQIADVSLVNIRHFCVCQIMKSEPRFKSPLQTHLLLLDRSPVQGCPEWCVHSLLSPPPGSQKCSCWCLNTLMSQLLLLHCRLPSKDKNTYTQHAYNQGFSGQHMGTLRQRQMLLDGSCQMQKIVSSHLKLICTETLIFFIGTVVHIKSKICIQSLNSSAVLTFYIYKNCLQVRRGTLCIREK